MINRYGVSKRGCQLKCFSTVQQATDSLDWQALKNGSNDAQFIVDYKECMVYRAKWCNLMNAIELIIS